VIEVVCGPLKFYIYRSEGGDYIVDDDVCTCKSFIGELAKGLFPCKHVCSERHAVRKLVLDLTDCSILITSLVLSPLEERNPTLSLLLTRGRGERDGKEKKEEEDHKD
jgi:hypothetical protein